MSRPVGGFSDALTMIKAGWRMAREGWNGKGMFLWLNPGSSPVRLDGVSTIDGVDASLFELGDSGTLCRLPNINMRSASGATVTGWLASQTDILAEDWLEAKE